MTETIQQLKEDIAILQEKLNKLEELENQPKMNLHNEGEFSIVSYDNRTYYRLQLPAASFWYIETIDDYGGCALEMIENLKTKNELESQWLMNDVKKGKYDDVTTTEPYKNVRAYWDKKDNPKPIDEVVDRLIKEQQAQKLRNMLKVQLDYDGMVCDDIVDIVEDWLPKEQSAEGSQNVNTELLVDGFNDCVRKMREMLR